MHASKLVEMICLQTSSSFLSYNLEVGLYPQLLIYKAIYR